MMSSDPASEHDLLVRRPAGGQITLHAKEKIGSSCSRESEQRAPHLASLSLSITAGPKTSSLSLFLFLSDLGTDRAPPRIVNGCTFCRKHGSASTSSLRHIFFLSSYLIYHVRPLQLFLTFL